MSAHTPTPWQVEGSIYEHMAAGIRGGSNRAIAQVWKGPRGHANAEFIVRACNAHDDLVAALKAIVDHNEASYSSEFELFATHVREAKKALAKAEGK
jgi:hypothetical protein